MLYRNTGYSHAGRTSQAPAFIYSPHPDLLKVCESEAEKVNVSEDVFMEGMELAVELSDVLGRICPPLGRYLRAQTMKIVKKGGPLAGAAHYPSTPWTALGMSKAPGFWNTLHTDTGDGTFGVIVWWQEGQVEGGWFRIHVGGEASDIVVPTHSGTALIMDTAGVFHHTERATGGDGVRYGCALVHKTRHSTAIFNNLTRHRKRMWGGFDGENDGSGESEED